MALSTRLRDTRARLNSALPAEALEDAFRKLTRPERADLKRHRALHRLLVNGVKVECRTREGEVRGAQARVIGFDEPANNDWLAKPVQRHGTLGRKIFPNSPAGRGTLRERPAAGGAGTQEYRKRERHDMRELAMENPTLIVRTDLDDQLSGAFAR